MLVAIFLLAGAFAAFAGGLFATLQTYITPEAFTFDLSVLFFIAILIGGRGSILGPLLGTIILTLLPEFAAPLAAWSTFLYAVLLLADRAGGARRHRRVAGFQEPAAAAVQPRHRAAAGAAAGHSAARARRTQRSALRGIALSFGAVRAIDGVDLDIAPGRIHGLIGPNGSGKTTILNVISGYYAPAERRRVTLGGVALAARARRRRAPARGIARTFQTPRIVGEASVLQNVMIGGTISGQGTLRRVAACRCRVTAQDERRLRGRSACSPCGSSGSKASRRCAPTACSTANCASWRSRAR